MKKVKLLTTPAPEIVATARKGLTIVTMAPTSDSSQIGCLGLICREVPQAHVWLGIRSACAVGVCSSGAQCQGDEADEASNETD